MLFNKTFIELCVLSVLISVIGTFLFTHTYFEIRDVRLEGLDAYSSGIIKHIITKELDKKYYRLPTNNYLLFDVGKLSEEFEKSVVLDSLRIEKKFPHSLIIHASERPIVAQFNATNGVAYVSIDGKLVRWYRQDEHIEGNSLIPVVHYGTEITEPSLRAQVVDPHVIKSIINAASEAYKITKNKFVGIVLTSATEDMLTLQFNPTLAVVVRINADLSVQLKKAAVSANKFPNAKKIDVRFADKVFVTF